MSSQDGATDFPQRLRTVREHRQLDQIELASLSGIPSTSISHFEAGRRKPSLVSLRSLADALQVSIDYLLGRTDNPEAHVDSAAFRDKRRMTEEDWYLIDSLRERFSNRSTE